MKNKLPWIVSAVLVIVLASGGFWYFKAKNAKAAGTSFIFGEVTRGTVIKKINATGTVQIPTQYNLSFNVKSKITQVNAAVGDTVKAGQVLAQLDNTVANQQVLQAKSSLAQAQARLAQLKAGATQADLIAAQNAVNKAQNNLNNAQAIYDKVKNAASLGDALNIDKSLNPNLYTTLNDVIQAEQRAVNSAQGDLNLAQAQLAAKQSGANSSDLQAAQAQVDQANSSLAIAQAALSDYTLVAPADGIIAAVNGKAGEYPGTSAGGSGSGAGGSGSGASNSSAQSAFIVLEASSPNVQINVPADEADVGSVKVNQSVDITLPAYPNKKFSGTVTQVSTIGQTQSGVTTFTVTVTAANPDGQMYAGMSANVSIIVDQKQNVLMVPSEAVRGSGSNKMVMLPPAEGSTQPGRQDVKIGLDDGSHAEVVGGLKEGDQIIVGFKASTGATQQRNSGSFGGMGSAFRGMSGGGGASNRGGARD